MQFLRDGQVSNRERAIEFYQQALVVEPEYALAHYNLGVLLYNRYLEDANALAIEHFQTASKSQEPMLRALSLSGLAMAYGQNKQRFGLEDASWVSLADAASKDALQIGPDLEEVHFARGWALQIAEQTSEALVSYQRAIDLPEDRPSDRQIKSFAQNNRAWLYMTKENDLDTAERLFLDAISRFPNKMAHDNLAEIYRRRGEYDRAISEYKEAITLDGRYVNGMNELAVVYLALARRDLDNGATSVQPLVDQAAEWHEKALLFVPETAAHQREQVERVFAEAKKEYGLQSVD
jgi:tetratricopeptide (TPR) repeat protein